MVESHDVSLTRNFVNVITFAQDCTGFILRDDLRRNYVTF